MTTHNQVHSDIHELYSVMIALIPCPVQIIENFSPLCVMSDLTYLMYYVLYR